MSSQIQDRLGVAAQMALRTEILRAQGQEIVCIGHPDRTGRIARIEVCARGNYSSVAAAGIDLCEPGDMIIHNHPSGNLSPSDADVAVSARLAGYGVGSAIVDNQVSAIYVLVEPVPPREIRPIDPDELQDILADQGAMAALLPGFRERPSQKEMLRQVARGFNESLVVVAEAGTGVGKSFAYLLPAVAWAAQNGERVVIATATITLQQQLLERDLVLVQRALGTDLKTALVKGRGNYLCHRRLDERLEEAELFDDRETIQAIREWSLTSPEGSRSDLPFHVSDEQWNRVNSEADTCCALRCSRREGCFVLRARQRAAGASLLVANHHLLFSDLAVRSAGVGWDATAILPPFSRLVLDEAHNLERSATSFFSHQTSGIALLRLGARVLRTRRGRRFGLLERVVPLGASAQGIARAEASLQRVRDEASRLNAGLLAFLGTENSWRLVEKEADRLADHLGGVLFDAQKAVLAVAEDLASIIREIPENLREEPPLIELASTIRRFEEVSALCERFAAAEIEADWILWMDRRRDSRGEPFVALCSTPLDIREVMEESLFQPHETVVLTSATLSVNGSFLFWGKRLGVPLDQGESLQGLFPSPFDYPNRVMLAVPSDAPAPESPDYGRYLTVLIPRLINASRGGALVLFTSYRQLELVYQAVAPDLEARGFSCYRQGSEDRSRLLEQFRSDLASVLFATDSFWEGVDVPGESLRLVVVCRLPFRVPTEPVQLARAEAVVEAGGNAFFELSLPQAVMRLKQGFGRLMRQADDYGAVVVADARMVRKRYGSFFWESLPPARPLVAPGEEVVEEVQSFLGAHGSAKETSSSVNPCSSVNARSPAKARGGRQPDDPLRSGDSAQPGTPIQPGDPVPLAAEQKKSLRGPEGYEKLAPQEG
ncbi:hypothetical protein AU468_12660 [Alkalispirochaeta sphaeroplastigenens]|uniref:DNA 5'-3' helicase n=1 Tax=Alkalispirochaeta sphaeroplastigenens TaxID=1187066 RepID=A0A2S4JGE1_9SPIO|nr:helicase C-terminal domain-containing protein [Alkalispirochaeta sphaeroplastigenens]POQ98591.1 hypothetical protein AU468_12660 [Alkalispirochaeta sphaeroplastigenens]